MIITISPSLHTYSYIYITLYCKALRDFQQKSILLELDDDGNTLGHKAASTGNSKLFKVCK